jgi:hypothetical protein
MAAAMIKPDLRTRKEQERVTSSPRKFEHLDLPAKEWSEALRSLVASWLEDELKRFTEGKVSDQAIYEFISKVFGAIGYSETWSNVKTMLYRRCAAEKQTELPSSVTGKESALKR